MNKSAFNTRLGARLKDAREAIRYTQDDAAQALKLNRPAIAQIEAGNRMVKSEELEIFAKIYQQPIQWFYKPDSTEDDKDVLVALLRSAVLDTKEQSKIQNIINDCILMYREGTSLSQTLSTENRIPPPKYDVPSPSNPGEAVAQGERIAEQERRRLNLGSLPITDMAALIDSQNIWVSTAPFPDSLSGLFLSQKSFGLAIMVNGTHVIARKRFSYAHEYCHALLDRDDIATATTRSNSGELVEKRANAFAAAFLLPADSLTETLDSMGKGGASKQNLAVYDVANDDRSDAQIRTSAKSQNISFQDAALIAHRFGVSYQTAVFRLINTNHISKPAGESLLVAKDHADKFLKMLGMAKDSTETEEASQRELHAQIIKYATDAYVQEKISLPKVREVIKLLGLENGFIDLIKCARDKQ